MAGTHLVQSAPGSSFLVFLGEQEGWEGLGRGGGGGRVAAGLFVMLDSYE